DRAGHAGRVPRLRGPAGAGVPPARLRLRHPLTGPSMHSCHKEATVGLLVILGVTGFIGGAMWLKGRAFGNPPTVHVAYPDVSTLKEGSPVSVSGAVIGQVETIALERPGR